MYNTCSFTSKYLLLAAAAALAFPFVAHAQTQIGITSGDAGSVIQNNTWAQSFTALSGGLSSFDFDLQTFNSGFTNNPITIDILQGAGTGGSLIGTETFSLADGFNGFAGATFATPLALTAGDVYTATINSSGPYWGIGIADDSGFTGGMAYIDGSTQYQPYYHDYTETEFEATFGAASSGGSVPDNGSTAILFGAAILGLVAIRRRGAAKSAV